jgi:hypothetical protein
MNKLALSLLGAAFASLLLADTAHAQITWGTPKNITGPSDIATNGTYVDALQTHTGYTKVTGGAVPITITNPDTKIDTKFNSYTSNGDSGGIPAKTFGDATFKISADAADGTDGSGSDATPYQQVLDQTTYTMHPRNGVVTMTGLTKGHKYQVQVWASAGYRPTTYKSDTNAASLNDPANPTGQFVIGTFTATGDTQYFTYENTRIIDVPAGEINAIALRDLGP